MKLSLSAIISRLFQVVWHAKCFPAIHPGIKLTWAVLRLLIQLCDISHIFQKTLNWDIANIALSDRRCQNRVRGSSGRARGLEGRGHKIRFSNHSIELTLVVISWIWYLISLGGLITRCRKEKRTCFQHKCSVTIWRTSCSWVSWDYVIHTLWRSLSMDQLYPFVII